MQGRYMNMIYIDDDENARLTGVGAMMESDEDTTNAFKLVKASEVDIKDARFILDLHEDNGDIVDSIAIIALTFSKVSGEIVKPDAEYVDYDNKQNQKAA